MFLNICIFPRLRFETDLRCDILPLTIIVIGQIMKYELSWEIFVAVFQPLCRKCFLLCYWCERACDWLFIKPPTSPTHTHFPLSPPPNNNFMIFLSKWWWPLKRYESWHFWQPEEPAIKSPFPSLKVKESLIAGYPRTCLHVFIYCAIFSQCTFSALCTRSLVRLSSV